jgi:hypothetical protein
VSKESQQKNDRPTPPASSSKSPAVATEEPASNTFPSISTLQPMSGVSEDWSATWLESGDIPWDPLLPYPYPLGEG